MEKHEVSCEHSDVFESYRDKNKGTLGEGEKATLSELRPESSGGQVIPQPGNRLLVPAG